jgi:hypothetical protein
MRTRARAGTWAWARTRVGRWMWRWMRRWARRRSRCWRRLRSWLFNRLFGWLFRSRLLGRRRFCLRSRLAWCLWSRRRSLNRLFLFVLAFVFRIVFSLSLRHDFLLNLILILNELDVSHLLFGRWRNQEEECQDEDRDHERDVDYVRAAGRLRHLEGFVCINLFAMSMKGSVIAIPDSKGDERHKQPDDYQGCWASKV